MHFAFEGCRISWMLEIVFEIFFISFNSVEKFSHAWGSLIMVIKSLQPVHDKQVEWRSIISHFIALLLNAKLTPAVLCFVYPLIGFVQRYHFKPICNHWIERGKSMINPPNICSTSISMWIVSLNGCDVVGTITFAYTNLGTLLLRVWSILKDLCIPLNSLWFRAFWVPNTVLFPKK